MMNKINKIVLLIGILLIILGFFSSQFTTLGITPVVGYIEIFMIVFGGFLILLSLVLQDKYKGTKL